MERKDNINIAYSGIQYELCYTGRTDGVPTIAKVIKELARHSDLKITSSHYLGDKDMNKNLLETWMKENRNID